MIIKFSDKTDEIIKTLALKAQDFGVKVYFVGGLVRDVIMGKTPLDIDILVEGNAVDFVSYLDFVQIKSVHKDFGTIKTQINGTDIDFASTREECYPYSGCLPVVEKIGCNIECDLKRRDFTINSMALEITPDGDYPLIDPFCGQNDIKNRTLKVLHKKSYIDDPTRILRGLDFKLRFEFDFSVQDKKLIEEYLKSPDREGLSIDRTVSTLKKLFCDNTRAVPAFREFYDKKYYRILYDDKNLSPQKIEKALKLFKIKDFGDAYVRYISDPAAQIVPLNTRLEIYKYFKTLTPVELCAYYAWTDDKNALLYFEELKDIKLNIKGSDLLALGYKQGREIGAALDKVLEAKLALNSRIFNYEDEIEFVKKNLIL